MVASERATMVFACSCLFEAFRQQMIQAAFLVSSIAVQAARSFMWNAVESIS